MVSEATAMLSTGEVAKVVGVTKAQVIRAIRRGEIKAQKIGWVWVVDRAEAKAWAQRRKSE